MKICPNCGIQCDDKVKFCGECGFSFANAPAPAAYDQQTAQDDGMEALEFLDEADFQVQQPVAPQPQPQMQEVVNPQPQMQANMQPQPQADVQPQMQADVQPQMQAAVQPQPQADAQQMAGGTLYTYPGPGGTTGGSGWHVFSGPEDMQGQGEPEIRTYGGAGAQSGQAAPVQQPQQAAPVQQSYQEAPAQQPYQEAPVQQSYQEAPAQQAYQQAPAGAPYYGNTQQQQQPRRSGKPPKRRKGKKKPAAVGRAKGGRSKLPLIIAIVAVVAIVAALAVFLVPRFLGGRNATDFVGSQLDFLADRAEIFTESLTKDSLSSDITISAGVDGDGEIADMAYEVLDGTSVAVKLDSSQKALLLNAALYLKGSNVLEGFFRMTPDELGFSVPNVDDTYYVGNITDLADTLGIDMADSDMKISGKELRADIGDIAKRYRKILTTHISKDKIETQKNRDVKLSEVGKTVKCTVMTWEPEEDDLIDLCDAIADELENDETLAGLLETTGLLDYGYDDGLDMLADYADDLRDSAEDVAADLVDNGFIWTVALDKKSQIALIMIQDDYSEVVYERAVDGKTGTEAFYVTDGSTDEMMVYNDYTVNGSKRTGEVSFDVQGSAFALEYDIDLSKKSVFGIPYGTYFTDLGDIAPGLEAELSVAGGKSGSADHVFTVSGLEDLTDDMISSADITVNATAKSSAKEPSGTKEDISDYDEEELMELLDTLGYDIIDALSESPELADLADLLMGY